MYRNDRLHFVYIPLFEVNDVQYLITLIQQTLCLLATSQGIDRSTLCSTLVSSVRCVTNYVLLIIVKIYNQMENTVLRICLLDRAYKIPQDIKSVRKSVFAVNCYNEVN